MTMRSAFFLFWITLSAATVWAQDGPNRPEPRPVALDTRSTAVLVLDLNARCDDPKQVCSKLTGPVGDFLDKARAAGVPIIYTVSASATGLGIAFAVWPAQDQSSLPDAKS